MPERSGCWWLRCVKGWAGPTSDSLPRRHRMMIGDSTCARGVDSACEMGALDLAVLWAATEGQDAVGSDAERNHIKNRVGTSNKQLHHG